MQYARFSRRVNYNLARVIERHLILRHQLQIQISMYSTTRSQLASYLGHLQVATVNVDEWAPATLERRHRLLAMVLCRINPHYFRTKARKSQCLFRVNRPGRSPDLETLCFVLQQRPRHAFALSARDTVHGNKFRLY